MSSPTSSPLASLALPLTVLAGGVLLALTGANLAGGHVAWFAARASGLTAYGLATASVIFGLATAARAGSRKPGQGVVADVHRALSLFTLLAIGGHVLFLAVDSYAKFGPVDLLVPFGSWYRPTGTGLGVLAGYLAVAVFASFYVRSLIGYRAWRIFHYAAFGIFVLGTVHGVMAGTDSRSVWAASIYVGAILAVALMGAYRLLRGIGPRPVWAFDESSGNVGAVRAVLVVVVLFAALVLPLWVFNQGTTGSTSAAQPAVAVSTGRPSASDSGGAGAGNAAQQQQGQGQDETEGQDQSSTARLSFAGDSQGSGLAPPVRDLASPRARSVTAGGSFLA